MVLLQHPIFRVTYFESGAFLNFENMDAGDFDPILYTNKETRLLEIKDEPPVTLPDSTKLLTVDQQLKEGFLVKNRWDHWIKYDIIRVYKDNHDMTHSFVLKSYERVA